MFGFLRNNMKLMLIFLLIGFAASMFAGIGAYILADRKNIVAIVNKDKIRMDELSYYFNNLMYQKRTENPNETLDADKIKKQAISQLIQEKIFLQEAKKVGEKVSEAEIQNMLMQYPIFQQNGQFDLQTYYNALRYTIRKSPTEFEKNVENNIMTEKIKLLIYSITKTSDRELSLEFETLSFALGYVPKSEFDQKFESGKKMLGLNDWFRNAAEKSKTEILLKE